MKRTTNCKNPPKIVAIIGEGITEWHYFNDLKHTEKYSFQIKPELPKHSDVEAIVCKALELRAKGYDKILCLFDLDRIISDNTEKIKYVKYKKKYHNSKGKGNIFFYETMPCIEYWFILHFEQYSTRTYPNYESLKAILFKHLNNYEKSEKYLKRIKLYQTLIKQGNLSLAIDNAAKLLIEKQTNDNELFPYSEIHLLLNELKK